MPISNKYRFNELCTLVDLPKRTVRFYIENDVVSRPEGANRGAYYTQRHVEQLLEIKKWQRAGLSLERIKSILDGIADGETTPPQIKNQSGDVAVWSHIFISDGVELLIEPKRSGLSPEKVTSLYQAVMKELSADICQDK